MTESRFQLEGRSGPDDEWTRYPVLFRTKDEATRALQHLQKTAVGGWPEYRIVRVALQSA